MKYNQTIKRDYSLGIIQISETHIDESFRKWIDYLSLSVFLVVFILHLVRLFFRSLFSLFKQSAQEINERPWLWIRMYERCAWFESIIWIRFDQIVFHRIGELEKLWAIGITIILFQIQWVHLERFRSIDLNYILHVLQLLWNWPKYLPDWLHFRCYSSNINAFHSIMFLFLDSLQNFHFLILSGQLVKFNGKSISKLLYFCF